MKAITTAVLMFTVAVTTWTQLAQAQDASATKPAPIEAFYCNMRDGKDMKDLMQAAKGASKWADKHDPSYSAWILTPQFGWFGQLPQVIWLGSSPSGDAFGKGLDAWQATGGDALQGLQSVLDCSLAHVLASSVEINAPEGIPGDGVVMFTQCNIAEGSDWTKAVKAHKAYSAAMRTLGAKNSNWIFFPMLGGADMDFDYWGVSTFNNWTDYFEAYELYVNGGGWQKGMEILSGVSSCNQRTPTTWDVKLVRKGAS
jgi:hypothetical protein